MTLNIPVGIAEFEKIRKNGYYYVDKSGLIAQLLRENPAEVTLITRPRRFGKTLGMSMLASFFDIRKDSRALFAGLEISKSPSLCEKWMNQWPVVFFTFKDVGGLSFSDAYHQLCMQFANLYKEHSYLLDCDRIDEDDKKIFVAVKAAQASEAQLKMALNTLLRMMNIYYGQPAILLLDEYDVPIAKASSKGYYEQMLEVMRVMMSSALKDNSALKFAVITGCLRIAKESIFTGTNNFVTDSITQSDFNEYFGFTEAEVEKLLTDADAAECAETVKNWYDGYHFGEFDIYCPWDVMNYVRDYQRSGLTKPISYWKNTSDNAIIRSFIDYSGSSITRKLEKLLSGGYIMQRIDENLTYDYLHSSEDNLWSILYLTGYLTKVREEALEMEVPDDMAALMIPNTEVREIFESTIMKWFQESAMEWNRKALFDAVWSGESETLTKEMTKLLRRTISYHDYREDFYHAFLAGIFAGAGYMVESNKEHGEGRSDVIVRNPVDGQVAVFEAKYSKSLDEMDADCNAALKQIDERIYAKEFEDDYDQVLCYGISFYKKRCKVLEKA